MKIDKSSLFNFYPLNQLSQTGLNQLEKGMRIRTFSKGYQLFEINEEPKDVVYLLSGDVVLINSENDITDIIRPGKAGEITPLPNLSPCTHSMYADTEISVLMIDLDLFNQVISEKLPESPQSRELWYRREDGTDSLKAPRPDWQDAFLKSSGFSRIAPQTMREVFKRFYAMPVSQGDVIITQGEMADYFYVIASGRCEVRRESETLGHSVKLSEYGVGACFGEDALISDHPRNATVVMLTDGCLMRLDGDDFRILLKTPMARGISYYEAKDMVEHGANWIDVRMPEQVRPGNRLPDSICIPFPIVRARLFAADPDRRYIVTCKDGTDSAVIAFVLCKYGYEAYYLTGGFNRIPQEALE